MPRANPARALRCLSRLPAPASHRTFPPAARVLSPAAPLLRLHSTHSSVQSTHDAHKSSVDPTEVSHFNALASSWWDPHGPSRLLHLMNPLRHSFIERCRMSAPAISASENLRFLDIGCGGGIFAESAARLPSTQSVTAIDPTPEVLKVAETHKRRDPLLMAPGKLTYLNTSIENLPLPKTLEEAYDIVSLFEVLEHVSSPSTFLEDVMQHVKPGGWLVGSTIARTWTSWLITNVIAEDVLGIVPKGTHEWSKYVNEGELREWFGRKQGWSEFNAMGVVYAPGLGWREVPGSEALGNYFFAVRREP